MKSIFFLFIVLLGANSISDGRSLRVLKENKVDICHLDGSGTWNTISVSSNGNAVTAHKNHGDFVCGENSLECNSSLGCVCVDGYEFEGEDGCIESTPAPTPEPPTGFCFCGPYGTCEQKETVWVCKCDDGSYPDDNVCVDPNVDDINDCASSTDYSLIQTSCQFTNQFFVPNAICDGACDVNTCCGDTTCGDINYPEELCSAVGQVLAPDGICNAGCGLEDCCSVISCGDEDEEMNKCDELGLLEFFDSSIGCPNGVCSSEICCPEPRIITCGEKGYDSICSGNNFEYFGVVIPETICPDGECSVDICCDGSEKVTCESVYNFDNFDNFDCPSGERVDGNRICLNGVCNTDSCCVPDTCSTYPVSACTNNGYEIVYDQSLKLCNGGCTLETCCRSRSCEEVYGYLSIQIGGDFSWYCNFHKNGATDFHADQPCGTCLFTECCHYP